MIQMPIASLPFVFLGFSMLCLALEFYLPGGIMGAFGLVFYGIALFFAFSNLEGISLFGFVVASVLLPIAVIARTLRAIKRSAHKNTIYLDKTQEGFCGAAYNRELVGKPGVAITDLSPSGFALVAGNRVQVISRSGYIEKGAEIIVKDGQGSHLIVQKSV